MFLLPVAVDKLLLVFLLAYDGGNCFYLDTGIQRSCELRGYVPWGVQSNQAL